MRKLFIHPAIRRYREPLYRALGQQGFEFLWTSINEDRPHELKEVKDILADFPFPNRIGRRWPFVSISNVSPDLLEALKFDLVVLSSATSFPFLLLSPLLSAAGKTVVLFDELWKYQDDVPRYARIKPYVQKRLHNDVDAVVAAGSAAQGLFARSFAYAQDRIFVAPNTTVDLASTRVPEAIDETVRSEIARFAQGRTTILYLGRIVRYKGLDVLLRALCGLPESACLIVVGSGPFEEECKRLTERAGMRERVLFMGSRPSDQAASFYRHTDIYAQPARFVAEPVNCESWGFTVNEALSLERPVVTTDAVGAAYDLIDDGETGLLVEQGSHPALRRALERLVMDPDLRSRLGQAGRRKLMRTCDYGASLRAFDAALRTAVTHRAARKGGSVTRS